MQSEHRPHRGLTDAPILVIGVDPDSADFEMVMAHIEEDQPADDLPVEQDLVVRCVLNPVQIPIRRVVSGCPN